MMDSVQKHSNYINIPSSQTFRSNLYFTSSHIKKYLEHVHFNFNSMQPKAYENYSIHPHIWTIINYLILILYLRKDTGMWEMLRQTFSDTHLGGGDRNRLRN
jgi:hypothetical protein